MAVDYKRCGACERTDRPISETRFGFVCQGCETALAAQEEPGDDIGPLPDWTMTYEIVVGEDGAEVIGSMNPAGSWAIIQEGSGDTARWWIQSPYQDEHQGNGFATFPDAVAHAVSEMVKSALNGDELG